MAIDISNDVKETKKEVSKERRLAQAGFTTVFQVEKYELDRDPAKCAMIGHDLMNNDENGVPKKVRVVFNASSDNVMGIQEYADENSLVHTMPGGKIRLDRVQERPDGTYEVPHMQRIQKKDGTRVDRAGIEHEMCIDRCWAKVIPERENRGRGPIAIKENSTGGKQSRGRVLLIPEDAKPITVTMGKNLDGSIKDAVKKAIELAPDKTKALLTFRVGQGSVLEMVVPNQTRNEAGDYVPVSLDEQLKRIERSDAYTTLMRVNKAKPELEGETLEALPGFQIDVFGMTHDKKTGQPVQGVPRVQAAVLETARFFKLPTQDENGNDQYKQSQFPEYRLSVVSYERQKNDSTNVATLTTLGKVPGHMPSPDAGESITPNPYFANKQVAQAEQASREAAQRKAQEAQNAPEQAAAQSQGNQQAQQPASQPQQAAAQAQPVDEELDAYDDMMEMDVDFDMDDLTQQLASQNL
ncbi:MAG: Uncharacterized protein AWU57_25 [Marinobacter sp. T13-3]|nr:MAG: Uncharacterized protein AWU57_25 [Marinobacter sp. T13-3]